MSSKNSGIELWKRASKVIPGGNGLLSKRPERYAPDLWPTYYKRANGVEIEDLDGHHYIDMAQMGLGTAILGYSHPQVDAAVKSAIDSGINTTLNAPEEVELAETLLELNPFAGGVKFARTGGEAMAMAVRIARANSGKDTVLFSGYHGWSDWYLAANLTDESCLTDHLLPGLTPKGVPSGLRGSAIPFRYNNVDEFLTVAKSNDFGVIVLEGARYDFPTPEFVEAVNRIAVEKNAIVILDEITSGWRMTDGGCYKLNEFKPDIVVYGKAMGNGFAISAVVGKESIMDSAQDTFISSTFWTERVGFVAALSTIQVLTKARGWEHLVRVGTTIGEGWCRLGRKHGLNITVTDFKPLISFAFNEGHQDVFLTTLFTQEMLRLGYLAASSVYVSMAHSDKIVDDYLVSVDQVFETLRTALSQGNLEKLLKTRVKEQGFKRLN